MSQKVTAHVDLELCIGNAMCRAAAPGAFVEGPGGQSVVADVESESLESLLEGAANCPVGAVTIADAETGEALELPW